MAAMVIVGKVVAAVLALAPTPTPTPTPTPSASAAAAAFETQTKNAQQHHHHLHQYQNHHHHYYCSSTTTTTPHHHYYYYYYYYISTSTALQSTTTTTTIPPQHRDFLHPLRRPSSSYSREQRDEDYEENESSRAAPSESMKDRENSRDRESDRKRGSDPRVPGCDFDADPPSSSLRSRPLQRIHVHAVEHIYVYMPCTEELRIKLGQPSPFALDDFSGKCARDTFVPLPPPSPPPPPAACYPWILRTMAPPYGLLWQMASSPGH
ncbi:hypothetical protein M0802_007309 [Mischocyttarus mexicanus]|nr:hypothetical protein M0802_007309 [Mischocyttarus mexicanus]